MYRLLIIVPLLLGPTSAAEHHYNFNSGNSSGWNVTDGSWSVSSQQYSIGAGSYGGKSVISGSSYSNLICDADITVNSGTWEAGILFRASQVSTGADSYYGYYAFIDVAGGTVGLARGPGFNVIGQTSKSLQPGVQYKITIMAVENRIRVFVDDQLYIDLDDATYTSGAVGVTAYVANVSFDNVLVSSETPGAMRESFAAGSGNWIEYDHPSHFNAVNSAYKVNADTYGAKAIFSNSQFIDYVIHCDVTLNGYSDAGILFRVEDPGSGADNYKGYYAAISAWEFTLSQGPGFNIIASTSNEGHFPGDHKFEEDKSPSGRPRVDPSDFARLWYRADSSDFISFQD